ncbi:MAG: VCBS repeat-containing protein [Planctomycetota bacterium]
MKRLWLFSIGIFFIAFILYPQESTLKFHQQNIEISGGVDNLVIRDIDGDKLQELIFQQGHNLLVYRMSSPAPGNGFTKSIVCRLPEDACIYEITGVEHSPGLVYINSKGVNSARLCSPTDKAPITVSCPTVFRNERFPVPLHKRILFSLDNDNRIAVAPDSGRFRIIPYNGALSGVITTTEVPINMASRVYDSHNIFEPLTTEATFPIFAFSDMDNDRKNDFITFFQGQACGFLCDGGKGVLSFNPAGSLLTIPEDAASQEIDFGYTLSPLVSDINKDGCADMLFSDDREGTVYIYLNQFAASRTFFAKTPTQIIRTNNWIIEHNLIDLNGDNLDDLVLVQMNKLGIMGGLQAILAKTLEWEIAVYSARPARDNTAGVYPQSPDYVRSIKLPFSFSYSSSLSLGRSVPKIQSPYIWCLAGDFNGDKMRDLLLSATESQVEIYSGIGAQIFSRTGSTSVSLSSAGRGYKLMGMPYGAPVVSDINNDGKSDMVIPFIRQDSAGGISHSYEILISN